MLSARKLLTSGNATSLGKLSLPTTRTDVGEEGGRREGKARRYARGERPFGCPGRKSKDPVARARPGR